MSPPLEIVFEPTFFIFIFLLEPLLQIHVPAFRNYSVGLNLRNTMWSHIQELCIAYLEVTMWGHFLVLQELCRAHFWKHVRAIRV